ncbi:hypothetical protein FA15DRAFT_658068 [Coprinopsis marcescibilis]|uniref:Uncharacterized protein n=1 Tax=Coprinopsis marcescibilis TaxID=230819 RepID=A0A5C3KPC9_COPMA|nr:hypothetical protein FA15DRAFT_658068 [Coprinopsis marcescibilis]
MDVRGTFQNVEEANANHRGAFPTGNNPSDIPYCSRRENDFHPQLGNVKHNITELWVKKNAGVHSSKDKCFQRSEKYWGIKPGSHTSLSAYAEEGKEAAQTEQVNILLSNPTPGELQCYICEWSVMVTDNLTSSIAFKSRLAGTSAKLARMDFHHFSFLLGLEEGREALRWRFRNSEVDANLLNSSSFIKTQRVSSKARSQSDKKQNVWSRHWKDPHLQPPSRPLPLRCGVPPAGAYTKSEKKTHENQKSHNFWELEVLPLTIPNHFPSFLNLRQQSICCMHGGEAEASESDDENQRLAASNDSDSRRKRLSRSGLYGPESTAATLQHQPSIRPRKSQNSPNSASFHAAYMPNNHHPDKFQQFLNRDPPGFSNRI